MLIISKNLIFKNKLLTLLMILQLALFVYLSNIYIGIYNDIFYTHDISYYFDDITIIHTFDKSLKNIIDCDELEKNFGVTIEFSYYSYSEKNCNVFSYPEKTMEIFRQFLKYGKWFDECENVDDDAIKTVIISNDKSMVGKYVTKFIYDKTYKFYVCGSFGSELFYLDTSTFSYSNTDTYIKMFSAKNDNNIAFLCEHNNKPDIITEQYSYGFAYIPKYNYSDATEYLKPDIQFVNFEQCRESDISDFEVTKTMIEPLLIAFAFLGIITLISMLILNTIVHQPLFNDFHKIGLGKKHILMVALYYYLFILAGIIIITLLLSATLGNFLINNIITDAYFYGKRNVIFNLVSAISLLALIIAIFMIQLRKRSKSNE